MGWAVNTHFCGGHAVKTSFSIGIKHLDCGMKNIKVSCENALMQSAQFSKTPCCENQSQQLEIDDNRPAVGFYFQTIDFVSPPFKARLFTHFPVSQRNTTESLSRPPPLLNQSNFQVLFQNFRI